MKRFFYLLLTLTLLSCKKKTVDPYINFESKDDILKETGYKNTHPVSVVNLGYPGFMATDLYAKEPLVFQEKPDLIIVMCGTNEVSQGLYSNFHDTLSKLLDDLKLSGADIISMSPPPVPVQGPYYEGLSAILPIYKTVSIEKKCMYIDINSYFQAAPDFENQLFVYDFIHPNASGYNLFAKQILNTYVKNNLSKYKIVCFGDSITYGLFVNGEGTITGDTYPAQLSYLLN